jgi:hemerythrin-like metal-binding protein
MLFVWDQNYNTGVDVIDNDHRKLVELINDLYEAMQDGTGGALLLPIFSALKHYTESHFSREESLMIQHSIPGLDEHCREHQIMVDKLENLEKRHRKGEAAISIQTLKFLRDWLTNHICVVDQNMAGQIQNKLASSLSS